MYKKYYSYNDMPMPIKPETKEIKMVADSVPTVRNTESEPVAKSEVREKNGKSSGLGGLLANLQLDDIILIVVVLSLLMEDCEDKMLLAAIAFILFSA